MKAVRCDMIEVKSAIARIWLGRGALTLGWNLALLTLLALTSVPAGLSQGPPRDIINRPPPMPTDPDSSNQIDPTEMQRRLNALNTERYKQMISDTNKLLKLAKELNDAVAVNAYDSLNPDQLRKVAQIEKLARSVKEAMSEGVGAPGPSIGRMPQGYPPR
jgi:hypothetical protein